MKDFASYLLNVAEKLKTSDYVEVHDIYGSTIVVAELSNVEYTEIKICYENNETHGIVYKVGITDSSKQSIMDYDKIDYFNENLKNPLILEYDELITVLLKFANLDRCFNVIISDVIFHLIADK